MQQVDNTKAIEHFLRQGRKTPKNLLGPGLIHPTAQIGRNVTLGFGVVIDDGVVIEDDVQIWHHCVIRSNTILRKGVIVGHLTLIERDTEIGEETVVHSQAHITAEAKIGKKIFFGPKVTCINERHITKFRHDVIPQKLEGPVIEDFCRIGTGALLLPGVWIGHNAIVGAGALVTKDIPPKQIWIGHPAKYWGMVKEEEILS